MNKNKLTKIKRPSSPPSSGELSRVLGDMEEALLWIDELQTSSLAVRDYLRAAHKDVALLHRRTERYEREIKKAADRIVASVKSRKMPLGEGLPGSPFSAP